MQCGRHIDLFQSIRAGCLKALKDFKSENNSPIKFFSYLDKQLNFLKCGRIIYFTPTQMSDSAMKEEQSKMTTRN